jgi:hypothetical protein
MPDLQTEFQAKVPPVVLNQAKNDVDVYLLEGQSVMSQQIAMLIDVNRSIDAQTKLTNGRVTAHDVRVAASETKIQKLEAVVADWKSYTGRMRRNWAFFVPILLIIADRVLERWFSKLWP